MLKGLSTDEYEMALEGMRRVLSKYRRDVSGQEFVREGEFALTREETIIALSVYQDISRVEENRTILDDLRDELYPLGIQFSIIGKEVH